ncbi:hypothetical protein [Acuticoccus sp.]|uniref:hypothetical protein n=1 Tax=Acuticoccus sp. TaxID=1904378 RepID=UPI003B517AF7
MKTVTIGLNEVEAMALSGSYLVEARSEASGDANVAAKGGSGAGVAKGTFSGSAGTYFLDIGYFNESDGASPYTLAINGTVVESWTGLGGAGASGTLMTRRIGVFLEDGDVIALTGRKESGEYARLDSLTIVPDDGSGPALPTIALGTIEAEDLDLGGDYVVEARSGASGGANIKSTGVGSARGRYEGDDGAFNLVVSYFDENDGQSSYSLSVNGTVVDTWAGRGGSGGAGVLTTRTIALDLADGDVVSLTGSKNAGEFARIDSLTLEERGTTPPPPPPGRIALGLNEAEALDLSGAYAVESRAEASGGANIKASGTGTASGVYDGADGAFDLVVSYFNESDGASDYRLSINGTVVATWSGVGGSGGAGVLTTRTVPVTLKDGDTIAITGSKDAGEFARVDSLTLKARSDAPPPEPGRLAVGLNEAEDLDLAGGYVVEPRAEASGGENIKTTTSGTASGVFEGAAGTHRIDVSYFNEGDGAAVYTLAVNGTAIDSWSGVGGSGSAGVLVGHATFDVDLAPGDVVTLSGTRRDGEFARVDTITLTPTDATPDFDPRDFDVFAFLGQSNAERHFSRASGDTSPGPLGSQVFADTIAAETGVTPTVIEAARGGSGSNPLADPRSFWWNLETDRPGQPLLEAVSAIRATLDAGADLDAIIWAQGEDDARAILNDFSNGAEIVDAMEAATLKVFQYLWARFDDVPIFIQELGTFPEGPGTWLGDPVGAIDAVRDGQDDLIAADGRVYLGASTAGLPDFDTIHFNVETYGIIAERLAQSVVDVLSDGGMGLA